MLKPQSTKEVRAMLGDNIKRIRRERGFTQELCRRLKSFSRLLDLSQFTLSFLG